MTRFLKIFINVILLLVLSLFTVGNIWGQKNTLSFLHISDTHVIFDLDFLRPDLAENRSGYKNGEATLQNFVETMPQKTESDFVLATGDLIDFFEGETASNKMLKFQAEQLVNLTNKSQVPFYFVLGNHDIISYSWGEGKRISNQNNVGKARTAWIKSAACFNEGTYYSKTFNTGETTYRFIFLEDGYYDFTDEENVKLPYIDKPQLHWLESQILESDKDVEIIVMHIPLSNDVAEKGGELFSVLAKYPSVKMIFAGHNHVNDIRKFPTGNGHEIVQVKTGAFAKDPSNWRKIELTDDKITISAPGKTKKELKIDL